jgi:hypothetical protein
VEFDKIPLYSYIVVGIILILYVLTAGPEEMDKRATEANNIATNTGINSIINEIEDISNPINIIGNEVFNKLDDQ